MPIVVVLDNREAALVEALAAWRDPSGPAATSDGWHVEVRALDVGDVAIESVLTGDASTATAAAAAAATPSTLVVLERKAAEDLAASHRDGRYREQRARLLALRGAGVAVGYVLEAPAWSATLSRSWGARGTRPFTEVDLQRSVARLQMRYGIPVLTSNSGPAGTAAWVRRLADMCAADPRVFQGGLAADATAAAAAYTEAVAVHKASNVTGERVTLRMLTAIPGVGLKMAQALAGHAGIAGLVAMDVDALAAVPLEGGKRRVGPKVAAAVYAALHE